MKRSHGAEHGFSLIEMLIVIILAGILTALVVIRIPSTTCTGVDTAAEGLASDMRLAKSLAQNGQKDYSVELFTNNPAGVTCYDDDPFYPYNRYQIIDKSDGSVYKNETKTLSTNVISLPLDGSSCSIGGSRYEQKFIFASDGTEKTEASVGNAAGNRIRVQSTSEKGCARNFDISVEPATGSITITKNGP